MSDATTTPPVSGLVDHLFRREYGRMVASLARIFGASRLDLAEDVVQEALARALKLWPFQGAPANPTAWLVQVAKRLALDAIRGDALERRKEADVLRWASARASGLESAADDSDEGVGDDRLRLMFACAHPSLPLEARVALTLKTLGGFGVGEIARAMLAQETAIAQRLVRAKARIRDEAIALAVPPDDELPRRLDGVLEVLYLMFNEGHTAHRGDELVREDVAREAVRLGELLLEVPALRKPRVHALLALMFLQGARLPARLDRDGSLATLAMQDRSRWDRAWIDRGFHHFDRSIAGEELTALHIEAAIAACHAAAPSYAETDWSTILERYDQLAALVDSPVAALNRAVAVAKVRGVGAGLAALDALEETRALDGYHLLPATRGLLLWSSARHADAAACFRRALELGGSEPERRLLERRIARCERSEDAEPF